MRIAVSPSGGFQPGDRVRVIDGPFKQLDGVVEPGDASAGKVRLALTIFGRTTHAEILASQIEKVEP